MDPLHRLQLARRIHLALVRELGQGIELKPMLDSALYARDVLLVCQAYPDTELPRLAEQFRDASAARRVAWPPDASGFAASGPAPADSGFEAPAGTLPAAPQPARRWRTPSTWFAR